MFFTFLSLALSLFDFLVVLILSESKQYEKSEMGAWLWIWDTKFLFSGEGYGNAALCVILSLHAYVNKTSLPASFQKGEKMNCLNIFLCKVYRWG